MKRFRKALLALAALLGVVIVGGIWLLNSALNVASDVVDSTLGGAQKVQAAAQKEVVGVARGAQNGAKATLSGAEHSLDMLDKPAPAPAKDAPTMPPANKTPEQIADKGANNAPKSVAEKNPKEEEDTLAGIGGLVSMFLNDGDDASDITDLLTLGGKETKADKDAKGDKPDNKNADDALTDMIPGANSPTVKGWMAGKYKGKESQALDDALEDPKIWRLVFFLGGGI